MAASLGFNFAAALKGAGGELHVRDINNDGSSGYNNPEPEEDSELNAPTLDTVGPSGLTKMDWWSHFETVFSKMDKRGTKFLKLGPHFAGHKEVFDTLRKQNVAGFELTSSIEDLNEDLLLDLHTVTLQVKDLFMQKCLSVFSNVYKHRRFGGQQMPLAEVGFFNKCLIDFIIGWSDTDKSEPWFADMAIYALVPWFNHTSTDYIKYLVLRLSQVIHHCESQTYVFERFLNVMSCWIVDVEFGLQLFHALGDLMMTLQDFSTGIFTGRVCEEVIPYVAPLGKPLPSYKEMYNLFVFYHCAAIRYSKMDEFNALLVSHLMRDLKFKAHEALLIVEEAFEDELVDLTYEGDFTEFLTCLDLPIRSNNPGILAARPRCCSHLTMSKEELKQQRHFDNKLKSHEDECRQHWKKDPQYRKTVKEKLDDALKMKEKVDAWLKDYRAEKKRKEEHSSKVRIEVASRSYSLPKVWKTIRKHYMNTKICANCLKMEDGDLKLLKCSGCQSTYYCGRKCQKQHWKLGHRDTCTA